MKSKMNKVAAAVVGAVAMMGAVSSANAADYASVQLGMSDVSGMDSGTAIIGTFGVLMPEVNEYFSVEGEFTKALGKPKHDLSYTWFGTTYKESWEVDYWTVAAYGVFTYPLNDQFSLRGRLGMLYEKVTVDYKDNFSGMSGSASDTDLGLAYGFGGTYKLNPKTNIIAEYNQIDSDITHLSAGVQFLF